MIANAAQPELAGTNFSGKTDVSGKKFRDEIVTNALKQGHGTVRYSYSNPLETGIFYKETYYTLVTGSDKRQYIVCAGRYLPCDDI
jgi:polar amino acid transport system substrate-binding protein